MLISYLEKLGRLQYIVVVALLAVTIGFGVLRGLDLVPTALCAAPPAYRAEVPPDVRARIDGLFAERLLYCGTLKADFEAVDPNVYWGSDGARSLLFFQALEGKTLAGVGIERYAYDDRDFPPPIGDARPDGYRLDIVGQPVWRNLAEGPAPTWYFRLDGPPRPTDATVVVSVQGPAALTRGLSDRSFEQDLMWVFDTLRGRTRGTWLIRRGTGIAIQPERWAALVHREINPALADERGQIVPETLARADLAQPSLLQTVQGRAISTVWVAGVVTGTRPALLLAPREPAGALPIRSIAEGDWVSALGPVRLRHFAFERQPVGTLLDARYWHDGGDVDARPPDVTWPVTFTDAPPEATTPGVATPVTGGSS